MPVEGHDSPDTSEGAWIPVQYFTPPFDRLLDEEWGSMRAGESRISRGGETVSAALTSKDQQIARMTIRPYGPERTWSSLDRYISQRGDGELVSYIYSVTGVGRESELLSLEITEHAPTVLQALRPTRLNWGMEVPHMPCTLGAATSLFPGEGGAGSRAALLALFDRSGRAAIVMRTDGEVLHLNEAAKLLIGAELAAGGRLRLDAPPGHPRFSSALRAAAARGSNSVPTHFAMRRRGDQAPLVVQVAPVDALIAGPDAALVLITDPAAPGHAPAVETLQLLGLTPGEARAAALVGGGLAPKEAASRLGVAESTVRSVLRLVYDKLGITRQSELVQIVGRLSYI